MSGNSASKRYLCATINNITCKSNNLFTKLVSLKGRLAPLISKCCLEIITRNGGGLDIPGSEPAAFIVSIAVVLSACRVDLVPLCQTFPAKFVLTSST